MGRIKEGSELQSAPSWSAPSPLHKSRVLAKSSRICQPHEPLKLQFSPFCSRADDTRLLTNLHSLCACLAGDLWDRTSEELTPEKATSIAAGSVESYSWRVQPHPEQKLLCTSYTRLSVFSSELYTGAQTDTPYLAILAVHEPHTARPKDHLLPRHDTYRQWF